MRDQVKGAVPAGSGWVSLMRMKFLELISFFENQHLGTLGQPWLYSPFIVRPTGPIGRLTLKPYPLIVMADYQLIGPNGCQLGVGRRGWAGGVQVGSWAYTGLSVSMITSQTD